MTSLIEIVPLSKPVTAAITVPGSKSITNRALVLAVMVKEKTTLRGALWSEDTQVMVQGLKTLGFEVQVEADAEECSNRTISVTGLGGAIPKAGTPERPLEIYVGNAGTAARFLAALVCLGRGVYRLSGSPRMHQRPQAALFRALRELGYVIDSRNDRLPATIFGSGPKAGRCNVSIEESSQFASALLLCAEAGGWEIGITGENAEESPYVSLTAKLISAFPKSGGEFEVEADASSGSYFRAAATLQEAAGSSDTGPDGSMPPKISVSRWPSSGWQIDERFAPWIEAMLLGAHSEPPRVRPSKEPDLAAAASLRGGKLKSGSTFENALPVESSPLRTVSRQNDLGDSIMTLIALAPLASRPWRFVQLARLRMQECERVAALKTELTKCGAKVTEIGDTLEIDPSPLHGAEIETYDDHRMAMCFAILGLKIPGIKIKNPSCVKKTFPDFFQKLGAMPPHGLGASIVDANTNRTLSLEELLAV